MVIYIKTLSGQTLEFSFEVFATIDELLAKCEEEGGLLVNDHRLVYAGKQLESGRTLSDYGIMDHATLHMLPSASRKARDQAYDSDEYLINPNTYYNQLDLLEKLVVETSEFYRTKGSYNPSRCQFETLDILESLQCHPEISNCLEQIAEASHQSERVNAPAEGILLSLGKSYLILSQVCDRLRLLTGKKFSYGSYTILIQRQARDGDVAELVEVVGTALTQFHTAIAVAIHSIEVVRRYEKEELSLEVYKPQLESACESMMEHLSATPREAISTYDILLLCRSLVDLLDLGLVSYMGSHGSRFDLDYAGDDLSSTLKEETVDPRIGFVCSLRHLACLDEFLGHRQVWVFRLLWATSSETQLTSTPLAVLTSIKAFADTWGPIWQVPAGDGFPNLIRQLNVSTGVICRIRTDSECAVKDAVPCHWFSRFTEIPSPPGSSGKESLIVQDEKLLIGGLEVPNLQKNAACPYKLDDLESDYGLHMTPLGTHASSWALEARQVGFSASNYIGVSVAGTQKKLPCTTLKQAIWNKWKNQPTTANPGILNSHLGVEISHCTGNARRIRLLDLFTLKPIQDLLARQFPDWSSASFGPSLNDAFHGRNSTYFSNVWFEHYLSRPRISELVCYVLELLEKTGPRGKEISAAFLNKDRELSITVDKRLNTWTELLEDSHLSAVYAVVNEACLDGGGFNNSVATCSFGPISAPSHTVFETQIAIPYDQTTEDTIRLNHGGCLQKLGTPYKGLQILAWESGKIRDLGGKLGRVLGSKQARALSREVQDKFELGGQHVPVLVKASVPSHGGLPAKRTRRPAHSVESDSLSDSLPIRSSSDRNQGEIEAVSQLQHPPASQDEVRAQA